jgi:hypothetical protein
MTTGTAANATTNHVKIARAAPQGTFVDATEATSQK